MRPIFVPLLATLAGYVAARYLGAYPDGSDGQAVLAAAGAAASVGATLLGFMLAALAVLASINHTHLVKMMRRYGHYDDLLATIFSGCAVMLAATVVGFALLFGAPAKTWVLALLVALHVGALASLLDVSRKFWFTLTHLRAE